MPVVKGYDSLIMLKAIDNYRLNEDDMWDNYDCKTDS